MNAHRSLLISLAVPAVFAASTAHAVTTWYVKVGGTGNGTSWTTPYGSLDSALGSAAPGDEIWVARGTYKPSVQLVSGQAQSVAFQMTNGVKIYGGFVGGETSLAQRSPRANLTVLSGDINNDGALDAGNSWHVVVCLPDDPDEVTDQTGLDGFVVKHGFADGTSPHSRGGGILVRYSSPAIVNCNFTDNYANAGGGGHVDGLNAMGGFMFEARPKFVSCSIQNNSANTEAGGMCNSWGEVTYYNCEFDSNTVVSKGGALYNHGNNGNSQITIVNCTFALNETTDEENGQGGAIWNGWGVTIKNSILWDDIAPYSAEVYTLTGATTTATYSNIENAPISGTGNQNLDPLFIWPTGGNLRLRCDSPLLDDSNNSAAPLLPLDQFDVDNDGITDTGSTTELTPDRDRKTRQIGAAIDLGAFERDNSCPANANGDNVVDIDDLLLVIAQWGTCGAAQCGGDVATVGGPDMCEGDGVIDINDLLAVVGHWGPCPNAPPDADDDPPQSIEDCRQGGRVMPRRSGVLEQRVPQLPAIAVRAGLDRLRRVVQCVNDQTRPRSHLVSGGVRLRWK